MSDEQKETDLRGIADRIRPILEEIDGDARHRVTCGIVASVLAMPINSKEFEVAVNAAAKVIQDYSTKTRAPGSSSRH